MFDGRTYRRFGYRGLCIGFEGRTRQDEESCRDGGVLTVTYASQFSDVDKDVMARRILAVLNLTSGFTLAQLENAAPLAGRPEDFGGFAGRAYRRMPAPCNLVIGFDGLCPLHGHFGKTGGFAMVTYADELEQAEKDWMARRVLAAMTMTRNLSLHRLENYGL